MKRISTPGTLWRWIVGSVALACMLGAIVFLAWPANAPRQQHSQLQVVAAENFWGNIASQLGGSHVQVTAILSDPNADPHLYESSAQDASEVSTADIVIENGLGYDTFMSKLLDASHIPNRQVITVAQVLGAPTGANQHLWYDLPRITVVAASITDAYIAKDPAHTSSYKHNLTVFEQSLQGVSDTLTTIRRQYGGTSVAYTEPVPGYLLTAAGLNDATPASFAKAIEDGNDPSPVDSERMSALITSKSIKVLLYNAQATSPVTEQVKQLASQYGIPVIGITETLPPQEHDFQTWQQDQLQHILAALGA